MRRTVLFVLVAAIGGILYFTLRPGTPARTFDAYELKAKDTAESLLSSVQTAQLVSHAAAAGRAFGPYVSVSLSESETAIGETSSGFAGLQPPDRRADRLREELSRVAARAENVVGQLRINARRGELSGLQRQAKPLARVVDQLERFTEAHG
ncbi:MAG TPA: hypothetical protein VFZ17_05725 [Acidimicrobiia bacterium]|nr:hypothetical protein [Acidimicrobiia bacterium]